MYEYSQENKDMWNNWMQANEKFEKRNENYRINEKIELIIKI